MAAIDNLQYQKPNFPIDRMLILDWYDAVLQGAVHCVEPPGWFYCWMVTWEFQATQSVYALRPVPESWVREVFAQLRTPPDWPDWQVGPKVSAGASHANLASLVDELFKTKPGSVSLARFSDLKARPDMCCEVTLAQLGAFAFPVGIEVLAEQPAEERHRIESYLHGPC